MVRARAVVVILAAVALAVGLYLAFSGGSTGDQSAGETSVPGDEGFTFEGEDGSVTFGQDGDEATLEFSDDDSSGTFNFDLNGDGVVTEGESGTFELGVGPPVGWPGDFPLPVGALPIRGSVLAASPLRQLSATYDLADLPEDVTAFYEGALGDDDPIVEVVSTAGVYDATISFEGRWVGFLSVTRVDGRTLLAIQIVEEQAAPDGG